MLNAEGVAEVAYTAEPIRLGSYEIDIDLIMKMTTAADWDHWITLRPVAARRIADQLNQAKPWKRNRPQLALTGAVGTSMVIDGEVVSGG